MFKIESIAYDDATFQPMIKGTFQATMELIQDMEMPIDVDDAIAKFFYQQMKEAIQTYKDSKKTEQ